jgi:hypothetical protein
MRSRADIYRAKADLCRQTAASSNDAAGQHRWLALADQWSKMAEHAKQDQRRDKRIVATLRSHALASGISLAP